MDQALIKDIKKVREKQAQEESAKTYALVCEHILLASEPRDCVLLVTKDHHPKHNGNIWGCSECASAFDKLDGLQKLDGKLYVAEEKIFAKKVKSFIQR